MLMFPVNRRAMCTCSFDSGVLQRRSPAKRRKANAHTVEPTSVAPANGGELTEFNDACTNIDSFKNLF